MKNLSELTRGRFHCYTSTNEEQIYTGDDISRLLKEVQEAQGIINKIKDMRRGLLGSALVSIMDEVCINIFQDMSISQRAYGLLGMEINYESEKNPISKYL